MSDSRRSSIGRYSFCVRCGEEASPDTQIVSCKLCQLRFHLTCCFPSLPDSQEIKSWVCDTCAEDPTMKRSYTFCIGCGKAPTRIKPLVSCQSCRASYHVGDCADEAGYSNEMCKTCQAPATGEGVTEIHNWSVLVDVFNDRPLARITGEKKLSNSVTSFTSSEIVHSVTPRILVTFHGSRIKLVGQMVARKDFKLSDDQYFLPEDISRFFLNGFPVTQWRRLIRGDLTPNELLTNSPTNSNRRKSLITAGGLSITALNHIKDSTLPRTERSSFASAEESSPSHKSASKIIQTTRSKRTSRTSEMPRRSSRLSGGSIRISGSLRRSSRLSGGRRSSIQPPKPTRKSIKKRSKHKPDKLIHVAQHTYEYETAHSGDSSPEKVGKVKVIKPKNKKDKSTKVDKRTKTKLKSSDTNDPKDPNEEPTTKRKGKVPDEHSPTLAPSPIDPAPLPDYREIAKARRLRMALARKKRRITEAQFKETATGVRKIAKTDGPLRDLQITKILKVATRQDRPDLLSQFLNSKRKEEDEHKDLTDMINTTPDKETRRSDRYQSDRRLSTASVASTIRRESSPPALTRKLSLHTGLTDNEDSPVRIFETRDNLGSPKSDDEPYAFASLDFVERKRTFDMRAATFIHGHRARRLRATHNPNTETDMSIALLGHQLRKQNTTQSQLPDDIDSDAELRAKVEEIDRRRKVALIRANTMEHENEDINYCGNDNDDDDVVL